MTIEQEMKSDGGASAAVEKVNGPAIAATLAAAIGSLALGIFTVLSEASTGIHDALEFSDKVGPLSGKTDLAVLVYIGAWLGLHAALKNRDLPWAPYIRGAAVLFGLGLLFTFPPFFLLFASE
ncbi:MAG: hypothetical protein Q7R41_17595 [Phycisphaerales bacterium]|nr:hypothetical protein [Phycisphaerales bacterium]